MSIPLFFPTVTYVRELSLKQSVSVKDLCQQVGVLCRASGAWIYRRIEITPGKQMSITAEPGDWGNVKIEIPVRDQKQQARIALSALAFGLHDLVAKQSVAGIEWLRPGPPRGRPRSARALSTRERQQRFRERRRQV